MKNEETKHWIDMFMIGSVENDDLMKQFSFTKLFYLLNTEELTQLLVSAVDDS
jgi:hypothetical protein